MLEANENCGEFGTIHLMFIVYCELIDHFVNCQGKLLSFGRKKANLKFI